MGVLSEEKYEEFMGKLEASIEEEAPEETAQEVVPETAQEAAPDSSDDSVDVKEEEGGSSSDAEDVKEGVETQAEGSEEEAPKTPEHIPYGRFKEVNDKFRARDDELQQAVQRIRELEQLTLAQAQQKPQPEKTEKSDDEWLDDVFREQGDPSKVALKQLTDEVMSVKQWQQERTEQLIASQLGAEIEAAVEKNPDVKAEELWQAVAADGSVDVNQAADYIQQHRTTMREQYLSEASKEIEELKAKLEEAEKVAQEDAKFRRPNATASAPATSKEAPRSVSEATNALAAAMKERMSF